MIKMDQVSKWDFFLMYGALHRETSMYVKVGTA